MHHLNNIKVEGVVNKNILSGILGFQDLGKMTFLVGIIIHL